MTKHRQCIAWSKGLRARLLPEPKLSDEEIAAAEVGGEDIAVIPAATWHVICSTYGLPEQVLHAVERGGVTALVDLLKQYQAMVLRPPDPSGPKVPV